LNSEPEFPRIARMGAERHKRSGARRARGFDASSVPHPMPTERMRVEDVRFFVGGHGRSGTTWLQRTLNTHPEVLCEGEGMLFGRSINTPKFGNRRLLYKVLAESEELKAWHAYGENFWTDPEEFERDAALIARAAMDALMRRALTESGKRVLGDRTPHHISHLKEVHALFPGAKVVHAVRDGRDVAISGLHSFWHNAQDKGGVVNLAPEEAEIREAYLEDREGFLASGRSIFTEERIRQRGHSWNRVVRQGRLTGLELFGENYIEFKYEEHLHRPHEALEELFEFLGVGTDPKVIDQIIEDNRFEKVAGRSQGEEYSGSFLRKGIQGDWEGVFTERDKRIFKEEAGELLIELGYEKDTDW
jgi:hypothetical protein